MGSEDISLQSFTEVLNHIITFWLTVDIDVQIEFILDFNNVLDFLFDEFLIFFGRDFTLGELVALNTDFLGLWERADSRCWEHWKLEFLLLLSNTCGKW